MNFKVRPNGIGFSGGPSITGPVVENLHSEVTFIQLYKIALSAGKAHRDHKHHHVHHFDHEGPITSTIPPPTPAPQVPQSINPLLANGQFPSRVRINFAGATNDPQLPVQGLPSQLVGGGLAPSTLNTQFVNGQYHTGGRILSEQLLTGNLLKQVGPSQATFSFPRPTSYAAQPLGSYSSHILFKRNDDSSTDKKVIKREANDEKKINKRGLVVLTDGSIIDDSLLDSEPFEFDGLAQFGAPAFKAHLTKMMNIEDEIKEHDREPAEGEVNAVMALCSTCDTEPFEGALIMGWKNSRGRTIHALKAKTTGGCGQF